MRTTMLRKIAAILMVALISTTTAFAADATLTSAPSDISGKTYETAVKALVEQGIVTGDTDGLFHPDATLTRAQACVIVVKSMNAPAADVTGTATQAAAKSGFSDMTGYGWAEGYVSYAVAHGVTKGYPDGTFKPGNKVTMNELITMVLRAAGYADSDLTGTWPSNYTDKAIELKLMTNMPEVLPVYATKWMAAQFDYNALDQIKTANPPSETPAQGTDQDRPSTLPDTGSMTYMNGSFNSTMTAYNGREISNSVTLYTYGIAKNYSSTMTFSNKLSDYLEVTVYKYKNTATPAFCKVENGKIVSMVIPANVGFSGRAYSVINSTVSTVNWDDEAVTGIKTLTATREITWLAKKGLAGIPAKTDFLKGELYELNLSDGEIQSIYKSTDASKKGDVFEEISSTGAIFVEVEKVTDNTVRITAADGGELFSVKGNASVYVLDADDPTEYTAGRISDIRAGVEVRAYDVSDDDERSADIVVVLK